jgi:hypothetical protein
MELETSNTPQDETVNEGKENKPPPIYLHNVINMNKFITDINNITNDNFRHVTTNGKVKLSCEITDNCRKIVTYLKTN